MKLGDHREEHLSWRKLAGQCWLLAERAPDEATRRMYETIAAAHEQYAEQLEARATGEPRGQNSHGGTLSRESPAEHADR